MNLMKYSSLSKQNFKVQILKLLTLSLFVTFVPACGDMSVSNGGNLTFQVANGTTETDSPNCNTGKVCGGVCCKSNQLCENQQCVDDPNKCVSTSTLVVKCSDPTKICLNDTCVTPRIACESLKCPNETKCDPVIGACVLDCGSNIKCGDVCCGSSEQCVNNICQEVSDTTPQHIKCVKENEPPEYCKRDEICINNECRTDATTNILCDPTQLKFCSIRSFCGVDESIVAPSLRETNKKCVEYNENETFSACSNSFDFSPQLKLAWHANINEDGSEKNGESRGIAIEDPSDPNKKIAEKNTELDYQSYGTGVGSTPLVADLDGDGVPEIIFISMFEDSRRRIAYQSDPDSFNGKPGASLWVISSKPYPNRKPDQPGPENSDSLVGGRPIVGNAKVLWRIDGVSHEGTPAIADVDGDGKPEIIVLLNNEKYLIKKDLVILNGETGDIKGKRFELDPTRDIKPREPLHVTVGVIDDQNTVGIAVRGALFTFNKELEKLCEFGDQRSSITSIVDLNSDGQYELVDRGNIFKIEKTGLTYSCPLVKPNPNDTKNGDNKTSRNDRTLSAVADIDPKKGGLEIVTTHNSTLYLTDNENNPIWSVKIRKETDRIYNIGGAPTVGDFDGNPKNGLEIAVASDDTFSLISASGDVIWQIDYADGDSGYLSNTAFDFNGDGYLDPIIQEGIRRESGKPEFLFNRIKVIDGKKQWEQGISSRDGKILFEFVNNSYTNVETPTVADIDGDGHADLLVPATPLVSDETHPYYSPPGLRVFSNPHWPGTRPIWNQLNYTITNINDDGTLPTIDVTDRTKPYYNTVRINPTTTDLRPSDLSVKIESVTDQNCNHKLRKIKVSLKNIGATDISQDTLSYAIFVKKHADTSYPAQPITKIDVPQQIGSGETITNEIDWTVPVELLNEPLDFKIEADKARNLNECNIKNNTFELTNQPVTAPNLVPHINNIDTLSCSATNKINVQYEIENKGSEDVASGTQVTVKLRSFNKEIASKNVTVEQAINSQSSYAGSISFDITNEHKNIPLSVEIIVDSNNLSECRIDDNKTINDDLTNVCYMAY